MKNAKVSRRLRLDGDTVTDMVALAIDDYLENGNEEGINILRNLEDEAGNKIPMDEIIEKIKQELDKEGERDGEK